MFQRKLDIRVTTHGVGLIVFLFDSWDLVESKFETIRDLITNNIMLSHLSRFWPELQSKFCRYCAHESVTNISCSIHRNEIIVSVGL